MTPLEKREYLKDWKMRKEKMMEGDPFEFLTDLLPKQHFEHDTNDKNDK